MIVLSTLSAGVFQTLHGCSHLQKKNPAKRVIDGRELDPVVLDGEMGYKRINYIL